MSRPTVAVPWRLYRFGLLVTGRGEEKFLDRLFRSLCERMDLTGRGSCAFSILAKIEQLTPRTSSKHHLTIGKKRIPTRDEEAALRATCLPPCRRRLRPAPG